MYVLGHGGHRQQWPVYPFRRARSVQSKWERSRRARRPAAERPSSWRSRVRRLTTGGVEEDEGDVGRSGECGVQQQSEEFGDVAMRIVGEAGLRGLNNVSMREQVLA
jgi:hypothetical protein